MKMSASGKRFVVEGWVRGYRSNPNKTVAEATRAFKGYAKAAEQNLRKMPAEQAFRATIEQLL